ncbi:unnamed protein product [Rotaria sp. Silwood2]|nr:unnamed protein product [Rotaria sp. Silwood2]
MIIVNDAGITPSIGPKRFGPSVLTIKHLPDDIYAILVSHNQFDHLDYFSVKSLNKRYSKRLTWFCGRGTRQWSRRSAFDLNNSLWGSFAVWDATHKFYFAGDTSYTHNISIFRHIGKKYGPFDLSAIPIGAYEPRWMMEAQHVSPDEAVQIHIDVQSKKIDRYSLEYMGISK